MSDAYEMKIADLKEENISLLDENTRLRIQLSDYKFLFEKFKACNNCIDVRSYTEKCHLCKNLNNWRPQVVEEIK